MTIIFYLMIIRVKYELSCMIILRHYSLMSDLICYTVSMI